MNTDIIYYGIFIDKESKNKLRQLVPAEVFKVYCDHMTLAHSNGFTDEVIDMCNGLLGKEFTLTATTLGKSSDAMAVGVETNCPSVNKHKHITLCTLTPQSKPVQSNYIQDWRKLKTPIILRGKVMGYTKSGLVENKKVNNRLTMITEQIIRRVVRESVNRLINEIEFPGVTKEPMDDSSKDYAELSKAIRKLLAKSTPNQPEENMSKQQAYLKYLMGDEYKPEYANLSNDELSKLFNQAKEKRGMKKEYEVIDTVAKQGRVTKYEFFTFVDAKMKLNELIQKYSSINGFELKKCYPNFYYIYDRRKLPKHKFNRGPFVIKIGKKRN